MTIADFIKTLNTVGIPLLEALLREAANKAASINYPNESDILDGLKKGDWDPFSSIVQASCSGYPSLQNWFEVAESKRELEKFIANKIGEFHQNLLGKAPRAENLATGHPTGLDLKIYSDTDTASGPRVIKGYAELKNKHNTTNSNSTDKLVEKLVAATTEERLEGYWVQIIAKGSTYKKVLNHKNVSYNGTNGNPVIYQVSGEWAYNTWFCEGAFSELVKLFPGLLKTAYSNINASQPAPAVLSDAFYKKLNKHIFNI